MTPAQDLQSQLENPALSEVRWTDQGETRGTFRVSRRVTLDISRTTLVGESAPAIVVSRGGDLFLKGGQISTSSRDPNASAVGGGYGWRVGPAIEIEQGGTVRFESVDVVGDVVGESRVAGEWHLPVVLPLPNLPPRARNTVRLRCVLPHEVEVVSEIDGVGPTQGRVGPGAVELGLDIDARDAEHGVLLDGWIRFSADGLMRRLRLRVRVALGSLAPGDGPVWQAELFERARREGIAPKNSPVPSPAPKATAQSNVGPAPAPANSLSAGSTGQQAAPTPSHSGSGTGQPPRRRELGLAFGKKPSGGSTAAMSASLPQSPPGAPSETPPSPFVPPNPPPAKSDPLPAGGGSTGSSGSKSAGLSSIFRPGSARFIPAPSVAAPPPVGPSAAGAEPASGVSAPISSPPSIPAADLPATPVPEAPSPEQAQGTSAPESGVTEPPKKATGGISSIFRRDRPTR